MNTIFLAGDSTCAYNGPETMPQAGWGQYLDQCVTSQWRVENHAVNGRSTKSFLDEQRFHRILETIQALDWLFIQFGHNDQKKEDPSRYTDAFTTYKENLKFMIEEVQKKGAKPLLLSSIPRRIFSEDGTITPSLGDYPASAKALAHKMHIPFIDAHELVTRWLEKTGEKQSTLFFVHVEKGEYPAFPDGYIDNTHLNHQGAKKVAELIAKEGKKLSLPYFF